MTAKRTPIRSKALRNSARGQRCTMNIPGICNYDAETVVLAHIHDETFGKGIKADDTSGAHMCSACHAAYDRHTHGLEPADLNAMLLRALQRTIRRLVQMEVLGLKQDAYTPPKPIQRKPKGQRTAIQGRADWPPKGTRKIQSRNDLRRQPEEVE